MTKPKILMLHYGTVPHLEEFADVSYWDINRSEEEFFSKALCADLIIEQEFNDGKALYNKLLDRVPSVKKAVWLIDSHVRTDHPEYAKSFDYVFVGTDYQRKQFQRVTHHLPVCYTLPRETIKVCTSEKVYDVGFVGQFLIMGGRAVLLQQLERDCAYRGLTTCFKTAYGEEYSKIISSSRVAFNKSVAKELNFRVFELMAMGVPQVTDFNSELMLIPGLLNRVTTYGEYSEIIPAIEKVLGKTYKEELKEAQDWILREHMLYHRMLKIIETCL